MDVPNDFNDGLSLSERPTYMQQHVLSRCTVTERPSWVRPSYNTCRDYQASGPYMQETTKNENIIPDRNNLDNDEVDLYRTMDSGSTGSSHGSDQPESNMNESMQNDDNDENKDVEFIEAHARQNQNGLERIIANNEFIEIIQTTQQWDAIPDSEGLCNNMYLAGITEDMFYFNRMMNHIRTAKKEAYDWLIQRVVSKWSLLFDNGCQYSIMTTNAS
ncbi:hypothetical protein M5K25_025640 [Dendrobium thyrsiflorum]|uniref:Transposase n=1 Tax=Dendrobium thyrsiflorum TaxID=117978 RepID=A0ABD0U4F9_DENTH